MRTVKEERFRDIAKVCHEANRAYCQTQGDESQTIWELAPAWQKESAIKGVEFNDVNRNSTPEDCHDSWASVKLAEGWKFGEEKNPALKTHPCLLPYKALPEAQQKKDAIFIAICRALL